MLEVLRSGWLSLGPMLGALRARARRVARRRRRGRGLERDRRAASRGAGGGMGRRRRGDHLAAELRRVRQLPPVRGRDAGVLRRRPGDAEPRSRGRAGGGRASATAGLLPVDIFGYPGRARRSSMRWPPSGASGCSRTACEALGAVDSDGVRVGARGEPCAFAFYANKQLTTGEGGALIPPDAEVAARVRERAKPGPRAGHGAPGARAAGLQLPAHGPGGGDRRRPARARGGDARPARRVARLYGERLRLGRRMSRATDGFLRCDDRGAERRSWFVYVVQLPEHADRDAAIAGLAQRGIAAKPTCRAST